VMIVFLYLNPSASTQQQHLRPGFEHDSKTWTELMLMFYLACRALTVYHLNSSTTARTYLICPPSSTSHVLPQPLPVQAAGQSHSQPMVQALIPQQAAAMAKTQACTLHTAPLDMEGKNTPLLTADLTMQGAVHTSTAAAGSLVEYH
jgi:hypothetical protein